MTPDTLFQYVPSPATLVKTERLSDFVTLFTFQPDSGKALMHKPGQFIMVSIYGVGEAPFSISSPPNATGSTFELAIRRIGNVTNAIHNLKVGQKVGIRGPYGSSFPVQDFVGKDTIFVAGGLGYIPLRSLLHYQLRHRDEFGRIIVMIGCRNPSERIFIDQIKELEAREDVEVYETVDCGDENWCGNVGLITTLLPNVDIDPDITHVAMVGPPVMYKFVIQQCRARGISRENIYVSLERHMKCGIGKCGHCQINGLNACIEGPVFKYHDIQTHPEAI